MPKPRNGMRTPRIYMGSLIGHPDPNEDPGQLGKVELINLMHELAHELGSATDPVYPGSIASELFGPQVDSIMERWERCAAECKKRGLTVYGADDTRSSAEGDRRWRERVVALRAQREEGS